MMQHEQIVGVHVGRDGYCLDTLGAPFNVILLNGVRVTIDPQTSEEVVTVTDISGLIGAVARARVKHPRKLNGAEIKFIRDALGLQAKALAEFLDVSPEHLSRCENGAKVLSSAVEKLFRCAAYLATRIPNPAEAFITPSEDQVEAIIEDLKGEAGKEMASFVNTFFSMKIDPMYNAEEEPLTFEFSRDQSVKCSGITNGDDDKWRQPKKAA